MSFIFKIKFNFKIKVFVFWLIMFNCNFWLWWWVCNILNCFFYKWGKGFIICWCFCIDVFFWNCFEIGDFIIIEDFIIVNNGFGDVFMGNWVCIGIGSVVIGLVMMGNGFGLGQYVFILGFNYGYQDGFKNFSV